MSNSAWRTRPQSESVVELRWPVIGRLGMFARVAAAVFGMIAWGAEEAHTVPYAPSAESEGRAGVVRVESRSGVSGQVRVVAVGDAGQRVEAGRLKLEAERGSAYATNLLLDGSVLSSAPGGMSRGVGGLHRVSLFPSASDGAGRRGVVRVVNRSPESAEVEIDAFDATDRAYERLRLSLGGEERRKHSRA